MIPSFTCRGLETMNHLLLAFQGHWSVDTLLLSVKVLLVRTNVGDCMTKFLSHKIRYKFSSVCFLVRFRMDSGDHARSLDFHNFAPYSTICMIESQPSIAKLFRRLHLSVVIL